MKSSTLYRTRCLVRDALLGALLIFSKELLGGLPNVEMVSMLLMAYATVYRFRALVPLYVFVAVEAVLYPYPPTILMYCYVWLVPVAATLLLGRGRVLPMPVYMLIGGLFGMAFGTLCAPAQAFWFGLHAQGTLAWIVAGLPYDVVHAVGNAAIACLSPVVARLLLRLERQAT